MVLRYLWTILIVVLTVINPIGVASSSNQHLVQPDEIARSVSLLESLGVPSAKLCHPTSNEHAPFLVQCLETEISTRRPSIATTARKFFQQRRRLEEVGEEGPHDDWFYISHVMCVFACICVAALAAGLTMGLLSLDPLFLLIKMRAGSTEKERQQAASLLPIVKQHHLLLVTLLLLNSIANEALPLFLEVLVSPVVAVILSVTLVLFFGEIIPSAVFTGPNKIQIAAKLTPLVRLVMLLLWPISFPIAKLLDMYLHDDGEGDAFNRGELSALVRIQYEERMATKQQRKREAALVKKNTKFVGGLDFPEEISSHPKVQSTAMAAAIRASRRESERHQETLGSMSVRCEESFAGDASIRHINQAKKDSYSIHVDEVGIVEGALQLKTKKAIDIFTPLNRVFSVPYTMKLTERNMVNIYSKGYSRVPVYEPNPSKPKDLQAIRGILMTKQLIVVNHNDERPVKTLPLHIPMCVSPTINLIDLLNLFQTGTAGHMALVCARPEKARKALGDDQPLPEAAGLMGYVV
jgi:metal transporter CNNM